MDQEEIQQAALDEALVSTADRVRIGSCNMRIDPNKKQKEATYQIILDTLKLSPCYNAFLIKADVPQIYLQQVPNKEFIAPPPHNALVSFLNELGYKCSMDLVSKIYIDHMYQPWRTFSTIINKCLSGKTLDIQYQIDNTQISAKRRKNMPYPRFTKVIIHHFLSMHNSIPKRHGSLINTIKDDGVLNSDSYLIYLALSTNTEPPMVGKGKGKGLMEKKKADTPAPKWKKSDPKKKSSITTEDNILPDPDEALKLGKSISLTEAKKRDEQKRVHDAHECLVTEKTASDEEYDETNDDEEGRLIRRRPTSVVIRRPVQTVSTKAKLDQPQKVKGIQILSEVIQLASDMQKATKASKKAYKIQQDPKGSSEGSGVNPEGSEGEVETLLSDEDRTKSDREKAKSKKVDDEVVDEEQTADEHDDEVKDNEVVVNEETSDEEVADDEKDNKEITDTNKADEEMVDAEKINAKKIKKEKVDEEQTRDDQADKDD
ncbi:hypothetical protein Tco_1447948 [Tanacetum coccineum]